MQTNNSLSIKKLTYTALLTAMAIVIALTVPKVIIPPFTATLTAHVPMFFAMFLGPVPAVMVGLGSAFGFFIALGPVVATRALSHIFVGLAGALMLKKKVSLKMVILLTAPIHGVLEAVFVIPFGFTVYKILVTIGVGTVIHHCIDGAIALMLIKALSSNPKTDFTKVLEN
jgi:niacin transporter